MMFYKAYHGQTPRSNMPFKTTKMKNYNEFLTFRTKVTYYLTILQHWFSQMALMLQHSVSQIL